MDLLERLEEAHTPDLAEACEKWAAGLKKVSQLEIKRWLGTTKDSQLRLWICVDASESAYCAAVYASFETDKGPAVPLIASRGSVAPAAKLTVTGLELSVNINKVNMYFVAWKKSF